MIRRAGANLRPKPHWGYVGAKWPFRLRLLSMNAQQLACFDPCLWISSLFFSKLLNWKRTTISNIKYSFTKLGKRLHWDNWDPILTFNSIFKILSVLMPSFEGGENSFDAQYVFSSWAASLIQMLETVDAQKRWGWSEWNGHCKWEHLMGKNYIYPNNFYSFFLSDSGNPPSFIMIGTLTPSMK